MLVVPWTTLFPSLLVIIVLLSWWVSDPKTLHLNLIVALGWVIFTCALAPDLTRHTVTVLRSYVAASAGVLYFENLVFKNASMIVTGAALVWLLRRSAQTLWKPVPELISILGVEVPAPPDVSLTAIGTDKATVSWTRPPPSRPVHKFVIQVNGVNVGESATNQDTFITVSGLKPNHFYNVRIIAVASNNFQAGSRVLRLRTFGEDGRPRLGSSRLPPGFSRADTQRSIETDDSAPKHVVATFAGAPPADSMPSPRRETEPLSVPGPQGRRNTVGRRHSPSTTSQDQLPVKGPNDPSEAEMAELNQRYLSLRRDAEEIAALIENEDEDSKKQIDELEAEKTEKRKEQKKKEEQTEKLRREQGTTDRSMRTAIQRKTQKEKQLKEKRADLCRLKETVARWSKGIEDMNKEQEVYDQQKAELKEEQDSKGSAFRESIEALQQECAQLETELKEKRQQVKELEDARQGLPGETAEDSEWPRERIEMKRDWQRRELAYRNQLLEENRRAANLDNHIHTLTAQLQHIPSSGYGLYNQANASGFDLDAFHGQIKRRSRTGTTLSNVAVPSPSQVHLDPNIPTGFSATRSGAPPFAIGPFMGFSADQPDSDEAGVRALMAGAPLSPSATSLLPSNIFADDEPSSPEWLRVNPFVPAQTGSPDEVPQSPASSARSLSILSSPQGSSHNLHFSQYTGENSERQSLKGLSSPTGPPNQSPATNTNKLGGFFSFQRSRGAKPLDEGPALGSLKHGQSQSFPRQTEDDLKQGRRISLSSWNVFNRNSVGPEIMEGHVVPPAKGFSARNLLPFASRGVANRDPSSPRPASIASSERPRPSTDSASIWGPPPDAMTKASRIWSMENPWSCNPSRRPSIHGSPSMLETNLASVEDEILDEEAIRASPSQVGVIGSRPPAAKKSLAKSLNPAAPTFMTNLFKTGKSEKDGSIKDKPKSKDKAKDKKDKAGKTSTPETPLGPAPPFFLSVEESPSDYSRRSRDGFSVHTQTSVSESRDSLSLDQSISNTPSEPTQAGAGTPKDPENAFRKLFRKDSTSKLSLTQRIRSRGKAGGANSNSSEKTPSGEHRSSFGDLEEHGDEMSLGRSFDGSVASSGGSPSFGPSKSRESKLGRATSGSWFSRKSKMNKEKESLEMERSATSGEWEEGNKV